MTGITLGGVRQGLAPVAGATIAHDLPVIPTDVPVEAALNALAVTINTLIARLEAAGVLKP